MASEHFFTPEMGARLAIIRLKVGFTQEQLAGRMGLKGPHRKVHIYRLEKGLVGNPSLRTVALFLRSCGARWSEFSDLLERVGVPEPNPEPLRRAELPPKVERRLLSKSRHDGWRFARGLIYPTLGKPARPDLVEYETRAFTGYRMLANLVEGAIRQLLLDDQINVSDHGKYLAFARHELGKLWRAGCKTPGRNRALRSDGIWEAAGLSPATAARIRAIVTELHEKVMKPRAQAASGSADK